MRIFSSGLCLLLFVLYGCGSSNNSSDGNDSRNIGGASLPCGQIGQNESCIQLSRADGYSESRHFIVHDSVREANAPLFIMLHGSGGRANSVADRFGFREYVNVNNFVGIFPDAVIRDDGVSTWNAHDNTYAIPYINDVRFLNEIIDYAIEELEVNPQRIYIFGWSNGGFMANRFACESPGSVTAIFTLAGNVRGNLEHCNLNDKVAIHHIHPTGDETVPFSGDSSKGYISAQEAIGLWAEHNQCGLGSSSYGPFDLTADEAGDESNRIEYDSCLKPVELTIIDGSDHGPDFYNSNLHEYMSEFFARAIE